MGPTAYFHSLGTDEQLKVCHARAVEWLSFPPVFCQSLIPIAYLFVRWYFVLGALLLASLVWPLIRLPLASFRVATIGVTLAYLRWPAIVLVSCYFLYRHEWGLAVLTLCTTLIVLTMSLPLISGRREMGNALTITFMGQMGYVPEESNSVDS